MFPALYGVGWRYLALAGCATTEVANSTPAGPSETYRTCLNQWTLLASEAHLHPSFACRSAVSLDASCSEVLQRVAADPVCTTFVSCQDIDAFEAVAQTLGAYGAAEYRRLANLMRSNQFLWQSRLFDNDIRRLDQIQWSTFDIDSLEAGTASSRAQIAELRCYDPEQTDRLERAEAVYDEALESRVGAERSCRADPACRASRLAHSVCALIAYQQETRRDMQLEQRNPSGVVSLPTLHALGERIQKNEHGIAEAKTEYQHQTHQPFRGDMCKPGKVTP